MKCIICNNEIEHKDFAPQFCSHECWSDNFWIDHANEHRAEPDKYPIVNGTMYYIDKENVADCNKGFGGRKFHIIFKNGTKVNTTNLWNIGDIPEKFRNRLPDTAEFDWSFIINDTNNKEEQNK